MIKEITYLDSSIRKNCNFKKINDFKIQLPYSVFESTSYTLKIVFEESIKLFRNHDYSWIDLSKKRIAGTHVPKILKLKNGRYVQPNINIGIWEVHKNNSNVLIWHFNPCNSKPLMNFEGIQNIKKVVQANSNLNSSKSIELLFSSFGLEVSRSINPFSAIACFTDHCDFDTLENLEAQRHFFAKHQIKITKGFFLNHYSKRSDNASFENHRDEFVKWNEQGHELAYHSLSQSLKKDEINMKDFMTFIPPFSNIRTWIDHGYQPYNLSTINKRNESLEIYEQVLKDKNVSILWNYLDSGTSCNGVINQLNTNHFTLNSYIAGTRNERFRERIKLNIKNILLHFFNGPEDQKLYKILSSDIKKTYSKSNWSRIKSLSKNGFKLILKIFSIVILWRTKRHEVYPMAKFTPLIFQHKIFNSFFHIFQTLEMVDFKSSLCKDNIDMLISESGIFIAHTYFSVPLEYHRGKLFSDKLSIDNEVDSNFNYLSKKIKDGSIWNPTLSELMEQFKKLDDVSFDISENGELFVVENLGLEIREVI